MKIKNYGALRTFPGKSLSRKDDSRIVIFPERRFPQTVTFPGKTFPGKTIPGKVGKTKEGFFSVLTYYKAKR